MYDITFIAYVRFSDQASTKQFANTLDPYPDEQQKTVSAKLSEFEELPKFNDIQYLSEFEMLLTFNQDAFLASQEIGKIAHKVGCHSCFGVELGDTKLFMHFRKDGLIKLIYCDDEEYDFEANTELKESLDGMNTQGVMKQLEFLVNHYPQ